MRFYFLFVSGVLAILLTQTAFACDVCGSFMGITPYDNQSGITLLHRYRLFSKIDVPGQSAFPSGAYRLQNPVAVLHTNHDSADMVKGDFESFKVIEVRGKWFVHQRVELNAILPFQMTRSMMHSSLEKISGMGDATFFVGLHAIRRTESKVKQRLVVGLGVKIPTGHCDRLNGSGERHHLYLQPGTGSFDEIAYLQYSIGAGRFGCSVNLTGKFNGENRFNERVKPSATSAMNFFVVYKRNTVVVLPQLQLYVEHTDGYSVNESMQPGSAMSMIMGGAGCDAYFGRLGAHISLQLPIAQKEIPDVPGATFRGVVGLSWNINQTNYLLD